MQGKRFIKKIRIMEKIVLACLMVCEIGVVVVGIKEYLIFLSVYEEVNLIISILYFVPYLMEIVGLIILMLVLKKLVKFAEKKYEKKENN